ncbi:Endonuclease/exonuclease/phosphatase [Desarmillaria tabescens]|uniref:Endonuclease/exonuclease/phosphatase n=1 Tax=Armillaria tabescens TaxID=1929756 RepID=A0AA39K191_ARMTA|nr:Endonuclease/exonuclease/phosphatase [Desarmillaria tabescens]KAK0452737.1 Endonuclease/exonuclease/phosphatase [Desarmillaria tabescens]
MKEQKISIMTLQETHLSDTYTKEVLALHGKQLSIHFSSDEQNPTGKSGVAIVLNKDLVKTEDVVTTNLLPGRALLVQAPWHGGATFHWLAIYVPNRENENKEMWEDLTRIWDEQRLPNIDGMSGDFNFVEDAIDRLPVHEDTCVTIEAFKTFCACLGLKDGWRRTNPDRKDYTYTQMSGNFSRSRIDRIYVLENAFKNSVYVRMAHPKASHVGKGRWSMPLHLLNNKKMAKDMRSSASNRNDGENPQTVYARGKKEIITVLQHYAGCSIPIKKAKMESLRAELDMMLQDDTIPEDDRLLLAALIQQRIQQIQGEISNNRRTMGLVKARLEMETISKYWLRARNPRKP